MKNYWIKSASRFFSNELEKDLYSIQLFEDEQTGERFKPSVIIAAYSLPAGWLVPCSYYDQVTSDGVTEDYVKIDKVMICDESGNFRETPIDNLFNLYCSKAFLIENEWD